MGQLQDAALWHSLWQQTVFPGGKKISGCKRRIVEKQKRCNTTKTACILTHTRVFTCNRDPHTQTDKAVIRKWPGCQSANETLQSSKVLPYECTHIQKKMQLYKHWHGIYEHVCCAVLADHDVVAGDSTIYIYTHTWFQTSGHRQIW